MHTTKQSSFANTYWVDIIFLTLAIGALFFIFLGMRPLFTPDEGRYAEIAREMINTHDYITPHLDGIKYFEKPALFYWLSAMAIHWGGPAITPLRSVNALLGLLGCLLTYFTARQLYDRLTGLLAASILATSALYFVMSHTISLDLPVTVFLSASLYAFLLGSHYPPNRTRYTYYCVAAIAAALAVLTKGLIGIVFPGLIISCWLLITRKWPIFNIIELISAIFLFICLTLPWHWLVATRNPEFFYFYFIEQHFLRYTDKNIGHYQPVWFFLPYLLIGFFPWIAFLPQTIRRLFVVAWSNREKASNDLFFLLWASLIFTFFSFSKSKLIPYILPIFPALAILVAHTLRNLIQEPPTSKPIRISYFSIVLASLAIGGLFYSVPWIRHNFNALEPICFLYLAATTLILGSLLAAGFCCRQHFQAAVITLVITTGLWLLSSLGAVPAFDTRSILPLAKTLKPVLTPTDVVVTYHQYYQDLPFYLERRVNIVGWKNELTYGSAHQIPAPSWLMNDDQFWQLYHSKQRVFVFLDQAEYQTLLVEHPHDHLNVWGRTLNNLVISNQAQPN